MITRTVTLPLAFPIPDVPSHRSAPTFRFPPPPAPPAPSPSVREVMQSVRSHARVMADDVVRDLTESSRALTPAGLPDKGTTALLRIWFTVAAALLGFLSASSVGGLVETARTLLAHVR